jgi:site-specific recombinase
MRCPWHEATAPDLSDLLARLDPQARTGQRHLWLISLTEWVRGDQRRSRRLDRVQAASRCGANAPRTAIALQAWWQVLVETVDITTCWPILALPAQRHGQRIAERLRHKLLPAAPKRLDASELFSSGPAHGFDAQWLAALPKPQLNRLVPCWRRKRLSATHLAVASRAAGRHHLLYRADPLHRLCARTAPAHE